MGTQPVLSCYLAARMDGLAACGFELVLWRSPSTSTSHAVLETGRFDDHRQAHS